MPDYAANYQALSTAYYDNRDWFAEESEAKCKLFISACIGLIGAVARSAAKGDERAEFDLNALREEKDFAVDWLTIKRQETSFADVSKATAQGAIYFDVSDYRF